jgi:hypothetical protein
LFNFREIYYLHREVGCWVEAKVISGLVVGFVEDDGTD